MLMIRVVMSCKRWLHLSFIIYISLTILYPLVLSQYEYYECSNNGNYTSESLYRSDLNGLLRSLSSNIDNTGFYRNSVGQASVIALCRADLQLNTCQGCVDIVADEILSKCPNQFQAVMWSEHCMVRYSNENIFGKLAMDHGSYYVFSVDNYSSPGSFKAVREELIDDVRAQAANGGSLRKAAAGNRTGPDGQNIFVLLQCTPDLSPENCSSCLVRAGLSIPEYVRDTLGIRVYTNSCTYRHENSMFYNITRLQEPLAPASLMPPPPLSPPPLVPALPPPTGKVKDNRTRTIVIVVVSVTVVAFVLVVIGVGIFSVKRTKKKTKEINPSILGGISTVESIQYDFGKIRAATNDFFDDNKLGQGGFGAVYKGRLVNGQEIAVKRLSRGSAQGDMEFKNEVLLLARLQHKNLVRLLGFSIEGIERLLVYEFVPNGSLDHFIFDLIKSSNLEWEGRYRIIVGIAKGVLYLHEDSRLMIIHRDLKASNVLLDEHMNPKIADFGTAKLVVPDITQEPTGRIVGTRGYMAPEYANYGQISIKSDVFSFGVIVLEIVSGQRSIFVQNGENIGNLLSYVWKRWREGTTSSIIDPILTATSGSQPDIMRCIHIALLCVQENAARRPTMAKVVSMLNSFSMTLEMPSEPGFYFSSTSTSHQEHNSEHLESSTPPSHRLLAQSAHFLNNEYSSIDDFYPR